MSGYGWRNADDQCASIGKDLSPRFLDVPPQRRAGPLVEKTSRDLVGVHVREGLVPFAPCLPASHGEIAEYYPKEVLTIESYDFSLTDRSFRLPVQLLKPL